MLTTCLAVVAFLITMRYNGRPQDRISDPIVIGCNVHTSWERYFDAEVLDGEVEANVEELICACSLRPLQHRNPLTSA